MKAAGFLLFMFLVSSAPETAAAAVGVSGTWQGLLENGAERHVILTITQAAKNHWLGVIHVPDDPDSADTTVGNPAASLQVNGANVTFEFGGARYTGLLSQDGNTIAGTLGPGQGHALNFRRAKRGAIWPLDSAAHKTLFVTVDKGVRLEVLDWGGTGTPLVFLAALGYTAHEFDKLAPHFTATHHVIGITRRGFGNSSQPDPATTDYSADRLGDDVLAAVKALKLDRPVLVGHSMAGEELSSIGSRFPEKVSGLVYLDAGYSYAFYAPGNIIPMGMNLMLAARDLRQKLDRLEVLPDQDRDLGPAMAEARASDVQFGKDLAATTDALKWDPAAKNPSTPPQTREARIQMAVLNGARKYTRIDVPILALFEGPPLLPADTPAAQRTVENAAFAAQANAFESGLPRAHVVRLANARHDLWMTNEADVIQEMNGFLAGLK
jgi:pimeloyl-ACP methyl ester carboxylesterase